MPNSEESAVLIQSLETTVGKKYVKSIEREMRRFTRGFRYGYGGATAVVLPGSLVELWEVLRICIRNDAIIIPQAANTGLTGGSSPFGDDYDRAVVVVSTMRLKGLHILGDASQILAFPGTTLNELETALAPLGREPHSVIGSSCLGASVIGGIANNSGGALVRRGPAFTEMALFARVAQDGQLELVNHLDIFLGNTPEEILHNLETRAYSDDQVAWNSGRRASDGDYITHVRDLEADTPARFNADVRRLYETSGSAGHVMAFAVRLDTFPMALNSKVFYVGTNNPEDLTTLRRSMLRSDIALPIAAEYIHGDAYDLAEIYGKDTFLLVQHLGTRHLPKVFEWKSRLDAMAERLRFLPSNFSDRALQLISRLLPSHLPARMTDFRARFEHHLILKIDAEASGETLSLLTSCLSKADNDFFECTAEEAKAAFLHRFATAGAAVRYCSVNSSAIGGLVSLDIALPRNTTTWKEELPPHLSSQIVQALYYGHFFCHVFHQDYIVRKGNDWLATEHALLAELDKRNARYPAEHSLGHLYKADDAVEAHYRNLDPCNCLNPGVGQTSKRIRWR